jgi:hypothetical protein
VVAAAASWYVPKPPVLVLESVVADAAAPGQVEPPVAVGDRAPPGQVAPVQSLMAQAETWMGSEALVFPEKQGERERAEVEAAWQWLRTDRDS